GAAAGASLSAPLSAAGARSPSAGAAGGAAALAPDGAGAVVEEGAAGDAPSLAEDDSAVAWLGLAVAAAGAAAFASGSASWASAAPTTRPPTASKAVMESHTRKRRSARRSEPRFALLSEMPWVLTGAASNEVGQKRKESASEIS